MAQSGGEEVGSSAASSQVACPGLPPPTSSHFVWGSPSNACAEDVEASIGL